MTTRRTERLLQIPAAILRISAPFIITIFLILVVLGARDLFGQTYILSPLPKFTGFDNSGAIIASGKLCTYAAGTTTPLVTYSDSSGTPNANPVVLDSAGRATIYLTSASFKFVLRSASATDCATGTILWTQDNIIAPTALTISGTTNVLAKFNAAGSNITDSTITDTGSAVSITVATTITTSATVPMVIGGTAATSSLILKSTSGVGTTDNVQLRAGNNGAVLMLFANTGGISVNIFSTTSLTVTNLTNTRIPITGTGGLLGDSANLTWSSPALTIGVAGSATGQMKLTGATSGTATLTCAATCGTPTVTIGTTTGTIAMVGDSLQQFAATTSAQLASVISDETGSGVLVFGTSPTLVTPTLGVATATRLGLGVPADASQQLSLSGLLVNGSGAAGLLTVTGSLRATEVGPHAIGGATATGRQFNILGSFTPASGATTEGLVLASTLTPAAASGDIWGARITPTLAEFSSGTHPTIVGIYIQPSITPGVALTTDLIGADVASITAATGTTYATGIRVAAPTGATNNRSIYVSSGDVRLSTSIAGTGEASTISLTGSDNTATARSTGVGTIKFADVTSRDNIGFWKLMIGTTAYYIPVFAAN